MIAESSLLESHHVQEPAAMPMSYVCDMDGVIYHGSRLIPGALDFVQRLRRDCQPHTRENFYQGCPSVRIESVEGMKGQEPWLI